MGNDWWLNNWLIGGVISNYCTCTHNRWKDSRCTEMPTTNLQKQEISKREHRSSQKLGWLCCACVSRSSFLLSTACLCLSGKWPDPEGGKAARTHCQDTGQYAQWRSFWSISIAAYACPCLSGKWPDPESDAAAQTRCQDTENYGQWRSSWLISIAAAACPRLSGKLADQVSYRSAR